MNSDPMSIDVISCLNYYTSGIRGKSREIVESEDRYSIREPASSEVEHFSTEIRPLSAGNTAIWDESMLNQRVAWVQPRTFRASEPAASLLELCSFRSSPVMCRQSRPYHEYQPGEDEWQA